MGCWLSSMISSMGFPGKSCRSIIALTTAASSSILNNQPPHSTPSPLIAGPGARDSLISSRGAPMRLLNSPPPPLWETYKLANYLFLLVHLAEYCIDIGHGSWIIEIFPCWSVITLAAPCSVCGKYGSTDRLTCLQYGVREGVERERAMTTLCGLYWVEEMWFFHNQGRIPQNLRAVVT